MRVYWRLLTGGQKHSRQLSPHFCIWKFAYFCVFHLTVKNTRGSSLLTFLDHNYNVMFDDCDDGVGQDDDDWWCSLWLMSVMMCGDEFWVTPVCYSPQIRLDRLEMHLLFREELNHLLIIKLVKYIWYESTCDRKVSQFFTVSIRCINAKVQTSLWWIYDSLVLWFLAYVDHYTSAYTIQCNLGLPKGKRSTNLWGRTVADNLKPDEKKI